MEEANFTGRHFDGGAFAIDRNKLRGLSGRTCNLRATTGMQFNRMDLRSRRNHSQRQAKTCAELDAIVGADQGIPLLNATRCEDVALFTIRIGKESEISRAIRIILDRLNLGRDIELLTAEVNDTVEALVTTTTTTRSDATVAITALFVMNACNETALWLLFGDVLLIPCEETLAGSQRSGIYEWHDVCPVGSLRA